MWVMASWFQPPGGDRTWSAAVFLCGGAYMLAVFAARGTLRLGVVGLTLILVGADLWRCRQWARYGAVAVMAVAALWMGNDLLTRSFVWWRLALCLGLGWMTWVVWTDFDSRRSAGQARDPSRKPMISFTLLLREPRYLDAPILAQIVSAAWGGDYSASENPGNGQEEGEAKDSRNERWVVGNSPLFLVRSPEGLFMVHNFDRPYFDSPDKAAADMPEVRLRQAIAENRAWVAVDLMVPHDASRSAESFYPAIGRLIAELAGPDCLAILHPDSGRINAWDESLEARLRGPDPLKEFATPVHVPVVEIDDDDPRMQAAVAEARRRWGEFVEAFNARRPGDYFAIKVPITVEGSREFIWIEVTGLEPNLVHGRLGNEPVNLGALKLGDALEVPLSDLNDWGFTRDDKPVGLFTLKVLAGTQAKNQQANG
jgi:uncharacterized protein YegJ (DUF2314 family)